MKKFLSILLVLAMVLALAACGGAAKPAETQAPAAAAPAATEAPAAPAEQPMILTWISLAAKSTSTILICRKKPGPTTHHS